MKLFVNAAYEIQYTQLWIWLRTTPRKQFLWIKETFLWYMVKEKISLNWKKFCWFKNIFFNVNKSISLDQRKFFELTELFLIQRNFFFDGVLKKCFFDSKKLFSQRKDVDKTWYFLDSKLFLDSLITRKSLKLLDNIVNQFNH